MTVMARLLTGIFACVLLPLGLAFTVIGLVADDVRSGSPEDFRYVGLAILGVGIADLAAFLALQRRHTQRRRRRVEGARAQAVLVQALLRPGVRVGVLHTYDLTVRFEPAGEVRQMVMVAPTIRLVPGEPIEVAYDPADPSNFEPAEHIRLTDKGRRS